MDADEAKMEVKMPLAKIKHDWYQTDSHVVVTILAKNMENVKVNYGEKTLSVSAELPSGDEYSLELDLANSIVIKQCLYKVTSSKIEIKLKKRDDIRWQELEGNPEHNAKSIPEEILRASKYPSSCKIPKDWDKIEKDIVKQDEVEQGRGEGAVNALFQNIYGKGTEEVKRAMNKSFLESGGTVLSTNWEEVRKETVQRKPPDGMEWKAWNS